MNETILLYTYKTSIIFSYKTIKLYNYLTICCVHAGLRGLTIKIVLR